ncbi:MAG: dihydropteroate synthase [Clostridia bacterium]|nr:dihydropteroate synthase [Clostridia bacterium]
MTFSENNWFRGKNFSFPLGKKTYVMGILNVTPDSFSDGGKFFSYENALSHAQQMEAAGADIIDVGAWSTRPGSVRITVEEEIERLSCLPALCDRLSVPVSVDTFNVKTAAYALDCGAAIINDVSGKYNPAMAELVRANGCGYIVMHAPLAEAGTDMVYPNGVCADIDAFFTQMLEQLTAAGIDAAQICLDPGFGFSKNTQDNLDILQHLDTLKRDGVCLLSAPSRKRFLGDVAGIKEADKRDVATAAAGVISIQKGADMIRVHDVAGCMQAVRTADAIYRR